MNHRSGDRGTGRRARWAAIAIVVVLAGSAAGCAGGDDGDAGASVDAAPTTAPTADGATSADEQPTSSLTTTTTVPSTTRPEGSVVVPIDDDLVARLPRVTDGEREVSTDDGFDERLCDGTKAPAVPKSQARATYPISRSDVLTVAAYRFASDEGPFYLAGYAEAVRSCAREATESEGLGLPDALGSSFVLTTERGEAFIAMALYEDVMWVMFQESTDGPVEVQQSTFDVFLRTVIG